MAEFDAKTRECRKGVDDETTSVAGVVIALLGIMPLLERTIDADGVGDPFVFPSCMRFATGLMNEHALLCDRPHHIVLNEFPHETAGTPLVDVRRRDLGYIPVLCNEFGFEPLVTVRRVVEDIGSSHRNSRWHALRARFTPLDADRHTCGAGTTSHGSELHLASLVPGRQEAGRHPQHRTVSHPLLSVPVGLLECDHEPGHECHESECQPRRPRCETPPEPPPQLAELITEGCPSFRFEDRDFVVVIAAIRGRRSECRLALAAGVFELRPDVLAAKFSLAALVVACDLVHEEL